MDYSNSFKALYPRKQYGRDIERAVAKICEDEWPMIMDALRKHIEFWLRERTPKKYIPLPSTYLNQRRFEETDLDEPLNNKSNYAVLIFIEALKNRSNTSLPEFSPDIKMAFFRMKTPWGQLQKMTPEEVTEKFERAYKNEPEEIKKKIPDRMTLAANDVD